MKLVIVESPAKSKTIANYLGQDYLVEASAGHIRDLKVKGKGGFGVDIENHFQPEYAILKDKQAIVAKLRDIAKIASHIYLASDPDREGEAISWHLEQVLEQPKNKISRIVFNEITKTAVKKALEHDRDIDMNLVHSQESRRILDRIIGFRLSSLLQTKIGSKSAGRVQSVALKIVVDREKEIEKFVKDEFWEIVAHFNKQNEKNVSFDIKAKFYGKKDEKINLKNETEAQAIIDALTDDGYFITNISKKSRNRASKPPFITSTLQQDASAKYNYTSKRVMSIAQKLYEGIDLGTERVGLITYMRTDSTRLSDEFVTAAKDFIIKNYGEKYYNAPKKVVNDKNAQDAHEGIRPTDVTRTPEKVKRFLSLEEYKIYSLIYNRAVSSLMSDAIIEDTKVDIENNGYLFNTSGEKTLFDGFLKIYEETSLENDEEIEKLPELQVGEKMNLTTINKEQKFTSPPSRYTEARLIKKMQELGIGRPSTYALTMETLKIRSYVRLEKKTFVPTEQGRLTSEQLDTYFSSIINVQYTANMELTLDKIAEGKAVWYDELQDFYDRFSPLVENARDNMPKLYPKLTNEFCPECGLPLLIRRGPYGEFTACSGYPHCKYIKKAEKKEVVTTGVVCPVCGEGEIVERVSGRGRSKGATFYACSRYPKCKATFSGIPTGEKCSECGHYLIKVNGVVRCSYEKCPTNKDLTEKNE